MIAEAGARRGDRLDGEVDGSETEIARLDRHEHRASASRGNRCGGTACRGPALGGEGACGRANDTATRLLLLHVWVDWLLTKTLSWPVRFTFTSICADWPTITALAARATRVPSSAPGI